MGNRTSRPCGLGFRITEPSARCTKKARRPSAGDGWSFCRACWLQQQGTQTEKQAHHALWRKRKAAKELQEVPVDPASHKDSECRGKQRECTAKKMKELPVDSAADKNSGELVECQGLSELVEASDYQSAATHEGIVLPIEGAADLQPVFTHSFVPQNPVHQSPKWKECGAGKDSKDKSPRHSDREDNAQSELHTIVTRMFEKIYEFRKQESKRRLGESFYCPNILRVGHFRPLSPPPSTPEESEMILDDSSSQEESVDSESESEECPETTQSIQVSGEGSQCHAPSAFMPCPRGKLLLQEVLRQLHSPNEKRSIEACLARFDVPSGNRAADDNSDEEEAGEHLCAVMHSCR